MAYKRRFRKRAYKKAAPKNNAKRIDALAKKIKVVAPVPVVKIRAESSQDCYTTPVVHLLSDGASTSTSPIQKSLLHSMWLKGMITQGTSLDETHYTRITVVVDKRKFDNDTAPTWLDVFETAEVFSHRIEGDNTTDSPVKGKSFKVLFDRVYKTAYYTQQVLNDKQLVNFYMNLRNMPMKNYAGYQQNQIYLMCMSTAATGQITFDPNCRWVVSEGQ